MASVGVSHAGGFIIWYVCLYILLLFSFSSITDEEWYVKLNKSGWYPYVFTSMIIVSSLFFVAMMLTLPPSYEIWYVWGLIGLFVQLFGFFILFQGRDVGMTLWIVGILMLYYTWFLRHIMVSQPILSIFVVPSVITNMFLFYSIYHIATLNNIVL